MSLRRRLSIKAEISPEELEMKENCDKVDAEKDAKAKELEEKFAKTSGFTKCMEYNHPKSLIPIGIFFTCINGVVNPALGYVFAKIMALLTVPVHYL